MTTHDSFQLLRNMDKFLTGPYKIDQLGDTGYTNQPKIDDPFI